MACKYYILRGAHSCGYSSSCALLAIELVFMTGGLYSWQCGPRACHIVLCHSHILPASNYLVHRNILKEVLFWVHDDHFKVYSMGIVMSLCTRLNNGTSVASMVLSTQVGQRGAVSQSLKDNPVRLTFTFNKVTVTCDSIMYHDLVFVIMTRLKLTLSHILLIIVHLTKLMITNF